MLKIKIRLDGRFPLIFSFVLLVIIELQVFKFLTPRFEGIYDKKIVFLFLILFTLMLYKLVYNIILNRAIKKYEKISAKINDRINQKSFDSIASFKIALNKADKYYVFYQKIFSKYSQSEVYQARKLANKLYDFLVTEIDHA